MPSKNDFNQKTQNPIPPSTNRGVTNKTQNSLKPGKRKDFRGFEKIQKLKKIDDFLEPKFDWFEGRFKETKVQDVINQLMPLFDDWVDHTYTSEIDRKKSPVQRGYKHSISFFKGAEPFLTLSYGGNNGEYGVYFKTTGMISHEVVRLIMSAYGITHNENVNLYETAKVLVTRVDVAIDFRADNIRVFRLAKRIGKKEKLKMSCAGDWVEKDPKAGDDGRTLYFKHTENVKLRIYEKGKQLRVVYGVEDAPEDWIRIEAQFRSPDGKNARLWKSVFAQLSPESIFSSVEPFVKITNKIVNGLTLNHTPIRYSQKVTPLGIEEFAHYLVKTFHNKLKSVLDSNISFRLFYHLYGDDFKDYPPVLKSQAMHDWLIENDINQFGEY